MSFNPAGCKEIAISVFGGLCLWFSWIVTYNVHMDIFQKLSSRLSFVDCGDKREVCYLWEGPTDESGYGLTHYNGKTKRVHRLFYELYLGEIPEGMVLDHTCHDPKKCHLGVDCPHRRCVNLVHLALVTRAENSARQYWNAHNGQKACAEAQRIKTQCPKGHPYTGNNLMVRPNGHRRCRECEQTWARERMRRRARVVQSSRV